MKNKKIKDNFFLSLLIAVGFSVALLLAISFIFAVAAFSSPDPTKNIGTFSLISLLSSAAISGITVSALRGRGGIALSALSALCVAVLIVLSSLILNKGALEAPTFMNCACFVGVATLGALLGRRKRKRR